MKPGDTRGQLTLIELVPGARVKKWKCVCTCGNTREVQQNHLVSGATKSCGCLARRVHRRMLDTLRQPQLVGRGA